MNKAQRHKGIRNTANFVPLQGGLYVKRNVWRHAEAG